MATKYTTLNADGTGTVPDVVNSSSFSVTSSYLLGVVNSSSLSISSSYSLTASFFLNSGVPTISASWASQSLSASYSGTSSFALSGGSTLTTGSTYPITSSWSGNSSTASFGANFTASNIFVPTGSISIGTTSPTYSLEVSAEIPSGPTFNGIRINNKTFSVSGNTVLEFFNSNPSYNAATARFASQLNVGGANPSFEFYSADSSKVLQRRMLIITNGNVGVGSQATPTALFHISGTLASQDLFQITNHSGSNLLYITSSGKIGIGTITPINRLDISGNISCSVITASLFGTSSHSNFSLTSSYVNGKVDILSTTGSFLQFNYVLRPDSTSMSLSASTAGGSLTAATYNYWVSFGVGDGNETEISELTSIATTGTTSVVTLTSIPTSSDARVSSRRIYRGTNAGSPQPLTTISDNTTTVFQDSGSITLQVRNPLRSVTPAGTEYGNTTSGYIYNNKGQRILEISQEGNIRFSNNDGGFRMPKKVSQDDMFNQFMIFNTTDEENISEYATMYYDTSNILQIGHFARNGAAAREVRINSTNGSGVGAFISILRAQTAPKGWFDFNESGTSIANLVFSRIQHDSWTATSGINTLLSLRLPSVAMSSTAGFRMLDLNITASSTGSGVAELLTIRNGSLYKFLVDNNGNVSIGGTTANTNKLQVEGNISCSVITASFYNGVTVIPIIQAGSSSLVAATSAIIVFNRAMPSSNYTVGMSANTTLTTPSWSGKTINGFTSSMGVFTGQLDWQVISNTQ